MSPYTLPALLVTLFAPLLGGAGAWFSSKEWAGRIARAASVASLAGAIGLLVTSASGSWFGWLGLDRLSDVFLVLVASIYATSTWYSEGYLRDVHEPFLTDHAYYALLGAFAFAMLLALSVTDLGLMWIGIEATTVTSALLIVLERKRSSVEAAWRYTLIASAGLTLALLALLVLYENTGTLNMFQLAAHPPPFTVAMGLVIALAMVGYGTKVGLFPMHSWLPDAHSEAPSPVSALFSGVLLPTALYAFLRVDAIAGPDAPDGLRWLIIGFGLSTALVGALLLQRQRSYKRLLAYSSMENMGLAAVGVGIGGVAVYGALLLVFAHAYAKSSAFYCAGNVLRRTGTTKMAEVRDLRHRLPYTSLAWVLSALAVTGAPPFGTFVGEIVILVGALAFGQPVVAVLVVLAILLAFVGVNHQIGVMVFTGERTGPLPGSVGDPVGGTIIAFANIGVALALGLVSIPYLGEGLRVGARILGGALP
jgi:hydrogenase-4 component F